MSISTRTHQLRIPLSLSMRNYRPEWFRADLIAGLVAAAVVIPKALAYATIAGLPVEVGLYTAFTPMAVYAILGSSRQLSVSTTTTIAILTAAALGAAVPGAEGSSLLKASATLTLLVGLVLLLAALLRLGFVANFISEPVLIGFKAGIGLVIVLDQVPKLLGTHITKGSFFHNILATIQSVPHTSILTLVVGGMTIAILLGVKHYLPKLPAPLIAVAAGIAAAAALRSHGLATVGHVPSGLPPVTLPIPKLLNTLWPAAVGIALMSFTETIAAGRAFVGVGDPVPRPNRELLATGLASAAGAFLGSMPIGGGTSQTAVNCSSGARSQVAALVTAATALVTMLLLGPVIGLMPQATLAAIVIAYSVGMIKPAEFRAILQVRRTEFLWALAAMAGVALIGTLQGIVVAIILSLLALAYQMADPPISVLARKPGTNVFRARSPDHPDDETFPGLLLLRPEGRLFFANIENVANKIQPLIAEAKPKIVAIDCRALFDLEYTALKVLTEAEQRRREEGILLWLVGLNPQVLAVVQRSPLGQILGRERMFFNLEQAVKRYCESQNGQTASQLSPVGAH